MGKIITAFLTGLAIGMLLSEDTRNKLMDSVTDAKDALQDQANKGLEGAEKLAGSLEARIRKAVN